jgi:hypothetical protein
LSSLLSSFCHRRVLADAKKCCATRECNAETLNIWGLGEVAFDTRVPIPMSED